jgi:predicted DNA-binding protein (MmcQ/YjbR family)
VSTRTLERVRRLCLALPEAREAMAWGHPVFKAGTKTFAAIEPVKGRPSIAFRLEPVDVDLLLKRPPFFVTPYGRGLWVSAWADAALDWALVGSLVERSYRTVALRRMVKALDDGAAPARQASPAVRHAQPPRRRRGKKI